MRLIPYARRTNRLDARQRKAGLALGGKPGARLWNQLAMPIRGNTVLRLMQRDPREAASTPRILGIDVGSGKRACHSATGT